MTEIQKENQIIELWPDNIQVIFKKYFSENPTPFEHKHSLQVFVQLTDLSLLDYNFKTKNIDSKTPFPIFLKLAYPNLDQLGINNLTNLDELSAILETNKDGGLGSKLIINMIDKLLVMKNLSKVTNRISRW